jgi:hypothetical protein
LASALGAHHGHRNPCGCTVDNDAQRIGGEMCIAFGRPRLLVPEHFADHEERVAIRRCEGREGMPEIMESYAVGSAKIRKGLAGDG